MYSSVAYSVTWIFGAYDKYGCMTTVNTIWVVLSARQEAASLLHAAV